MVIDITIIILLLIAVVVGARQGILTQICYLIALIATLHVAPNIATYIGSYFADNEITAHAIGFGVMLIGAAVLVWLIAPILKKLLFWDFLRRINTLLGAIVALVTTTIILSIICTSLNTANLGEIDREQVSELICNCESEQEIESKLNKVFDKDVSMRNYFEPRLIEYKTLDESLLFNKLIWLGDKTYPYIGSLQNKIAEIKDFTTKIIAERVINNDFTE